MSIVVFSGTTEGRKISEYLSDKKISHYVSVATESGEVVMTKSDYANVHIGRMDQDEMRSFLKDVDAENVFDATHPYAQIVTENIFNVCEELGVYYTRVIRNGAYENDNMLFGHNDAKSCGEALLKTEGNILLTTGSKELKCYTEHEALRNRIYARVLPSLDAIELCKDAGIDERHIIAMYGPHTESMNEAIIKQYDIRHLVTKDSGSNGGFSEKITAAKNTGCQIHIIKRPDEKKGISLSECFDVIDKMVDGGLTPSRGQTSFGGQTLSWGQTPVKLSISLVGIGAGNKDSLTIAAKRAIDEADFVLGAKRMIDTYDGKARKLAIYKAEEIIEFLDKLINREDEQKNVMGSDPMGTFESKINVAVLFSGDTGIYSGATKLYEKINEWGKCDNLKMIPGISSFSAFAAKLGVAYGDACLESLHGKSDEPDNLKRISELIDQKKTVFLLMSGKSDFGVLRGLIPEVDNGDVTLDIGYNLSYEDEKIIRELPANEAFAALADMAEGLYIVRVSFK